MRGELAAGIETAYRERIDLVVFALAGRTGSGCSTAAARLGSPFDALQLTDEDLSTPEKRKFGILRDYAEVHWHPFSTISVSSVIYSFLLEASPSEVENALRSLDLAEPSSIARLLEDLESLRDAPGYAGFQQALAPGSDPKPAWAFFHQHVHLHAVSLRNKCARDFSTIFQRLGDNIRRSGRPTDGTIRPTALFALMERVGKLIQAVTAHNRSAVEPARFTRVVVDAIRNPLELVYLRDHFAPLYVLAITVDDTIRRDRLARLGFGNTQITALDKKEYSNRQHLEDYRTFVSQNLRDCIQKADVFVSNPGIPAEGERSFRHMDAQLVRYVSLALRPGLVTPTRDERCMQAAFVAKLNSGCISRQVGAAVADATYSIQAVGWNDVPQGQTPCLLRDVDALLNGRDGAAFSEYELENAALRSHLSAEFANRGALAISDGLRCPFCFKDAHNTVREEKNQVFTRSLHAEENAFLQIAKRGGAGIAGGVLYTTASPCELCSKKAYQLGIKEVIYVDPYPGISAPHILGAGDPARRPQLRLFNGAIGHAYHRLYEPLLPIKDEYLVRLNAATHGATSRRRRARASGGPELEVGARQARRCRRAQ